MPPSYAAAYVKRGKTDAADAAAICEAVTRPTMRFVPIKTAEQQAVLMLHRTRDLLVRLRTMLVTALRGHLAELGIIAPQGIARVADLIAVLFGEDTMNVPALAREALRGLAAEQEALDRRVKEIEGAIVRWHKDNEASRRLAAIPGVGPITASAIVATIIDPFQFHSARHLAAWIGLVPRQHSSGGKQRQGGISKQGDRHLYEQGGAQPGARQCSAILEKSIHFALDRSSAKSSACREGRGLLSVGLQRYPPGTKRHVWTTPSKQGRFGMCAAVGCGHVSGPRCAALGPLALMQFAAWLPNRFTRWNGA
jgi:hypothetical protein